MEITLELIVFTVLALFIGVSAILAVTTRRILRAATYLLFVLFGTARPGSHTGLSRWRGSPGR